MKSQNTIIPVILSGGYGTRLWPLSRKQYPKQYLPLAGDNTMLQETILRLNGLDNLASPIIVCNAEHRFLVAEQCQKIDISNPTILLEPVGRNTAPAIVAAALQSLKMTDNGVLLVLSADHVIEDINTFHRAIDSALKQANDNKLVTFGIVPTDANTGYGYIKSLKNGQVEAFVEKPDLQTAQSYLKQGNYLWNSGMFMFQPQILINEFTMHSPDIVSAVSDAVNNATQDLDFIRLEKQAFEFSPSDSIDYALLEKSSNVVVVPLKSQWNDIGAWSALYDIGTKDKDDNVIKGDVSAIDTTNTYINAHHHMVVTIGVDNLIIVDTPDATLIATQDKVHKVKGIVEYLHKNRRNESSEHRKVHRPWGWYDTIESGDYFQVKRLHVKSGAKLSLQRHRKRAEHWVVVSGVATVINGEELLTLEEGESTYISIGIIHALENKSNKSLEVIEVQSGVYLGEDDIERLEDIYGRN
ncbi:Mannose-1-phosphate guanylyltransferase (EC / Mannose-6-phosphate isomerase (EC [Bathymodiolus thermophilus thioautotrophic gill symbiont]|jgi:mannose-1-phosphate guanylyltransferase/mannose-6-phosphate isomerase|uniref:Mannose-1-phosphate guanylyltransferase ) n=3 Tax=sulfur-oxidizing symbionts TaxID=32036 RepID=A0ACA8ZMY9_9GAMM|nr:MULTISPECIES: mannose-1-phosphate guanylyltransferase/mannose-6-phosphate isomerase [sulfur-oxidizing symbionts]CAC9493719.1 Mannose-1-phosphate guanylyltransferase (EC 2.7.7.13) / Mannose-6-phosphate isomerase (EC 5.3.1.8) [uncultured Gammaproteobacteria bacterium]CAB5495395.1 Mannose-1-phosphate guanylyltransferase (EC / Mannose-6-phosphate isomerase (EC [Bathymodiolus azoricus thioautotrophic gill symbiont]CAB5500020.1 Mannose-1-phosphate guanylyltransferase (EC / Mannose-6-phosphate isome